MATGLSLHIGVEMLNNNHYSGEFPILQGCVEDAKTMFEIAKKKGFKSLTLSPLLNTKVIAEDVKRIILNASTKLKDGDTFFLTFSGHGAQIPSNVEPDNFNETWCFFDRMLIDNELGSLWRGFAKGVRIVVVSDSCHSGTMFEVNLLVASHKKQSTIKSLKSSVASATYFKNQPIYDSILNNNPPINLSSLKLGILFIAACQDNQETQDGLNNGVFTSSIKQLWNGGKFQGSYNDFYEDLLIKFTVPQRKPPQVPKLTNEGQIKFADSAAFTI